MTTTDAVSQALHEAHSGPLRVLVVGDGQMASQHVRAFVAHDDATVCGVVGPSDARVKAFAERHSIASYGTNLIQMYRETLPELIVAAVAVPAVPAVYPELLKLDATLLLEKPFGLDFSESQILQKIAHSVGARAFIAMNRRQYGNLRFAREALDLDSGTRLVQILDQESFEHPIQACWPSSVVKRWMYGNAIHLVDLARFFCRGEVSSVVSSGWRGFQTSPMLLTARIEFDSGDLAAYEALWSVDGPWSVAIATESQRWEMRPLEACRWRSSMSSPWTEVPPTKADLDFKPGLYLQATEAIRAARGRPHTLQSIDSALKSIELLSRIYTES